MAFRLSHQLLCLHSPKTGPTSHSQKLIAGNHPSSSARLRAIPRKSSPEKNSTVGSLKSSALEDKLNAGPEPESRCRGKDRPGSGLALFDGLSGGVFKFDGLIMEILSIALPAALSLAADPIASLVDTAFVGHIGSAELAAIGVSVSVFNLIAKFFNVPLLNVTTSFVAEEQASMSNGGDYSSQTYEGFQGALGGKKYLPLISTSLSLAAIIGVSETIALSFGSSFIMSIMGIPTDSPMWAPAQQFLTLRAFGAPPVVVALAAQGAFRGFMDTKTPLYAIVAGNLLNAILDPILIFSCGLGIGGAAIATVISEYLIAFILLWKLSANVLLVPGNIDGRKLSRYFTSGGLLIGRSVAVLTTTTLATSLAAREGAIRMAGHQICFQVWLAISLLTDALALAGQSLLANGYFEGNYKQARRVIYRVLQIGLAMGVGLAVILFLGFGAFSSLFTEDSEVLHIALSGLLFVAGSQPVNALAFVVDGLYYGVSDFGYAAYSMVIAALISCIFMVVVAPSFGLAGVWSGLFLFMALRVVAGFWRLSTKSGPWEMVWNMNDQDSE